eukprot:3075764-Prymnesium_polylepis.2
MVAGMGWRAYLRCADHRRAQRRRLRRLAIDHLPMLLPARRPAPAPPTWGTVPLILQRLRPWRRRLDWYVA